MTFSKDFIPVLPPRSALRPLALWLALGLGACASVEPSSLNRPQAAISDRSDSVKKNLSTSKEHLVVPGETLKTIATRYNLKVQELARINKLENPDRIEVGQVLSLRPERDPRPSPVVSAAATEASAAKAKTTAPAPAPSAKVVADNDPKPTTSKAAPAPLLSKAVDKPDPAAKAGSATPAPVPAPPKAEKSDKAEKPEKEDSAKLDSAKAEAGSELAWAWPTKGKVASEFGQQGSKGISIGGQSGQSVKAAAAGQVVYAGSGLKGYGQLVVVKHNAEFISVYAHNKKILVKQGDKLKAGANIALMGDTDSNTVGLHFEIRRKGVPVDPLKYLP